MLLLITSRSGLTDGDDSELYDFSYIIDNDDPDSRIIVNTAGSNYYYYMMDYQVADPRQNLNEIDWNEEVDSGVYLDISTITPTSFGSFGTVNTNYFIPNPGGNSDSEPSTTEPWELSTAYIRNAPMLSPWELGFIHRGKAWQTLNLKKYNMTEWEAGDSGGGNDYSDGDANLLDQIKMTHDTITQGKVNINSQIQDTLKVLFQKIRVGSNVGSGSGPGTIYKENASNPGEDDIGNFAYQVGTTEANSLASDIITITSNKDNEFLTRAQLLRSDQGIPALYIIIL